MDATYKRILTTINNKPRPQRELARRVLIWIAYMRSPLQIDDLAYAISIELDTRSLEDLESSIPTKEYILDACANLVSVDKENNSDGGRYVRFVHFSVQEFLTSERSTTLSMGYKTVHREIARTCMLYLTLFPFPKQSASRRLYWYAFHQWPHHLLAGNLNSLLVDDQILDSDSDIIILRKTPHTTYCST